MELQVSEYGVIITVTLLLTPLLTPREPPSRVQGSRLRVPGLGPGSVFRV